MQQLCIFFFMGLESIISYANSSVYLVDDVGISWESVEDLPQRSDVKEPVERSYMCLNKGRKEREAAERATENFPSITKTDDKWRTAGRVQPHTQNSTVSLEMRLKCEDGPPKSPVTLKNTLFSGSIHPFSTTYKGDVSKYNQSSPDSLPFITTYSSSNRTLRRFPTQPRDNPSISWLLQV